MGNCFKKMLNIQYDVIKKEDNIKISCNKDTSYIIIDEYTKKCVKDNYVLVT